MWFAHAIRGPACLLVVFAHLFDLFPNQQALVAQLAHFEPVAGLPSVPWAGAVRFLERLGISPGTVGVTLFFLVSGFVIPFSLQNREPRGFFVRRFFRLYPTLWVCLLVTAATLFVQARVQGTALPYGQGELGASALLVSQYTSLPWVEPVLWSLAVEELFYLLAVVLAWPGLLASRVAVLTAAAGMAAVCVATKGATAAGPLFWLGFNATYVCFILIGVVVHQLYGRAWAPVESVAIGAAVFGLYVLGTHHGPATGVANIYIPSSALALAVFGGLFLARDRLPYSRLLDRLSDISYPLYLLHGINGYLLLRAGYALTGSYYVAVAVTVAAALLAATAVHHWVERPTNDFGRRLSRRLRVTAAEEAPYVEGLQAQPVP